MTVKFLVLGEDLDEDNVEWRDLHIDESKIIGWYLPDELDSINVLMNGNTYTFKLEDNIKDYLIKFVE